MRKILFLAANPQMSARTRLDQESRDIREGLQRSRHRDSFQIVQRWATRPIDLLRAVQEELPQVVHFSGSMEGESGLHLEDSEGRPQLVEGTALASLFKLFGQKANIDCVVLNGCYSQDQAQHIASHVPYVIGTPQSVDEQAAIDFSIGFYDALGVGDSIDIAFESGKVAMVLNGASEKIIPTLLTVIAPNEKGDNLDSTPFRHAEDSPAETAKLQKETLEVFFSYAHEDEALRNKLANHLKALERQRIISSWSGQDITAGEDSYDQVLSRINQADIILLLISEAFIASDFIWGVELERAMTLHSEKSVCVIPIILRPVDWEGLPFARLQALPRNSTPITSWTDQDQAFVDVAKGIRQVAEQLKK